MARDEEDTRDCFEVEAMEEEASVEWEEGALRECRYLSRVDFIVSVDAVMDFLWGKPTNRTCVLSSATSHLVETLPIPPTIENCDDILMVIR